MIICSHQDRKTLSCDINIKIIWFYQRVIFIVRFIHRILKFTFKLCAGSILGPSFKWKMLAVLKTSHWPEMPIDLQYLNLHFFRLDGNKPELADKSRGMNNWVKISQLRWKKVVLIISCPGNWRLAGIIISHIRETIKEDNCLLQVISWQKLIFLVRHDIISWYFWPSYLSYVHMETLQAWKYFDLFERWLTSRSVLCRWWSLQTGVLSYLHWRERAESCIEVGGGGTSRPDRTSCFSWRNNWYLGGSRSYQYV